MERTSATYITSNLEFIRPKNAIFKLFGWGIFENDAAPQKTNKDRTNTLLPPSFRQVFEGLAEEFGGLF